MKSKWLNLSYKQLVYISLLSWFVLSVVQACITPMHFDECYYWLYAQRLDWGYFDHPPAVAVLIYLSELLFGGNLAVRAMTILAQFASMWFIYDSLSIKNKYSRYDYMLVFLLLFMLLPLNTLFSFITTPDVPLLVTTAAFFWMTKRIFENHSWNNTIWWGIIMACMLYSKYHSGLVILLFLISQPKWFTNIKTYVAGALGLALFIPHVLWQFDYDFASIQFHLKERGLLYKSTYPLEYIGNVIIVFSPFLIDYLFRLFRKKTSSDYHRGLKFCLYGFVLFFFYQSFRVGVQAQWLYVCYIPFLILLLDLWDIELLKRRLAWALLVAIPIFIVLRSLLAFDLLESDLKFHRQEQRVQSIIEDAKGLPVVYFNDYKRASLHSWYSDQKFTPSFSWAKGRKSQFNIWEQDSIYYGQDVYFVGSWSTGRNWKRYPDGSYGKVVKYGPGSRVQVSVQSFRLDDDKVHATIEIKNPYAYSFNIKEGADRLGVYYFKDKRALSEVYIFKNIDFKIPEKSVQIFEVEWPRIADDRYDHFGFGFGPATIDNASVYQRVPLNK